MIFVFVHKLHDAYPKGVHTFDCDDEARAIIDSGIGYAFPAAEFSQRLREAGQSEPIHHPTRERSEDVRVAADIVADVKHALRMLNHPIVAAAVKAIVAGDKPTSPDRIIPRV